MIEPTETESQETLDAFAETLFRITGEDPQICCTMRRTRRRSAGRMKCGRRGSRCWPGGKVSRAMNDSDCKSQPSNCKLKIEPGESGHCRLIIDSPAAGAWNMAVDEVLLARRRTMASPRCGSTSGASRRCRSVISSDMPSGRKHAASSGCAIVRRQSGGGAILHDRELTYSLRPARPAIRLLARPIASIGECMTCLSTARTAARRVRQGWSNRCDSRRRNRAMPRDQEPFLCFQRRTRGDVVVSGTAGWKVRGVRRQIPQALISRF